MNPEKPKQVRQAVYGADHNALSRMGKKGAEHAAISRSLNVLERQKRLQEVALEQAKIMTLSPDGDVLPPDPEVIASLEEQN